LDLNSCLLNNKGDDDDDDYYFLALIPDRVSKDLMMEVLLPAAAGALLGTSGRREIILWVVASSR
jgi:hypothetical protein